MKSFSCSYTVEQDIIANPYNHAHHADCIRILEQGRLRLYEAIGHSQEQMASNNLFLVISSIEVAFLREVRGKEYTITCENPRLDKKAILLNQQLLDSRGKAVIQATVKSVFIDGVRRRSIPPPEDFFGNLMKFLG